MRVSDVAKQLKVSPSTVRNLVKDGKLHCEMNSVGQRYFTQDDVDTYLGVRQEEHLVFYVRSSSGSKAMMDAQVAELTAKYGVPEKVYSDSASGLNENRTGLARLIRDAEKGKFTTIAVTYEDRLSRFGGIILRTLFAQNRVELLVLHDSVKYSAEEELMNDFMSLVSSFSGKFYRMRSTENKKKLLERAGEQLA